MKYNIYYMYLSGHSLFGKHWIYCDRADMQALFRFDKLLKTARKKKKNSTTAETKPAVLSFLNEVAAMF